MAMTAAKCSACGAPIEVNDARREGYCSFCGTKYIAQDIIQNTVNNSYVVNNIGTAIVQGGDTAETLYERFAAVMELGDLHAAECAAEEMREKFPQRALSWYCAALYEEKRIGDELRLGRERIGNYIGNLYFPDARKSLSEQFIADTCSGILSGLEAARPTPDRIDARNVGRALEAARKFETAEERSRYGDLIRSAEDGAAACARQRKSFEYAEAAQREAETKTEEWRRSAEEYLRGYRKRAGQAAAQSGPGGRRARRTVSRMAVIIAIAVIVIAVAAGIVQRML